jgi:hypothetical protein
LIHIGALHVAAERLGLLLCFKEVPGSNLSLVTGNPDRLVMVFLSSLKEDARIFP